MKRGQDLSISVAIPTRKRAGSLICCIGSVLRNDRPELREIIVVANPDDRAALEYCAELAKTQPKMKVEICPLPCRNTAKNQAVAAASSEYIYFLDDDITLPPGNIKALCAKIRQHPDAAAIGGPNVTPENSCTIWEQAIGLVLLQPFATYMTRARYIAAPRDFKATENALQSCNLCMKKSALANYSRPFETSFFSGEETLLLYRLRKDGLAMISSPELKAEHHRRSGFASFCRQIFLCGAGRAQMSRLEPQSFKTVFAIPALFVLYMAALAFCPPLRQYPASLWPLYPYFALLVLSVAATSLTSPLKPALLTLLLIPALHLSYGSGFIVGLLGNKKTPKAIR